MQVQCLGSYDSMIRVFPGIRQLAKICMCIINLGILYNVLLLFSQPWVRVSRFQWEESPPGFSLTGWIFGVWGSDSIGASVQRSADGSCGITVGHVNIGIATILGTRTLITSANIMEPYLNELDDIRVWCLGRAGEPFTPYRYRVWRSRRVLPRSNNPEHWHGPLGRQVPRHDVAIITTMDQIYFNEHYFYRYAFKNTLVLKRDTLPPEFYIWGSGYESRAHIKDNYRITKGEFTIDDVVNCEKFLPKWWGKFICIKNKYGFSAAPTGGPLVDRFKKIYAIGCFAINYNEERILVFTDLRYYVNRINIIANYTVGDYYEYAYPEWSVSKGWFYDSSGKGFVIPQHQMDWSSLYPLG